MDLKRTRSIAEDPTPPVLTAAVPAELHGTRLDAAAARLFPDYSRARLQAWIEEGRLTVNGAAAPRSRDPVRTGDRLELEPVVEVEHAIMAQDIPLDVVYEDRHIAIVNKPAGLTVHPGAGQSDRTLQNALLHRYPQTAKVPRAGIIHRLDKDTSGILVVALTLKAHTRLVETLAAREIRREYDALVAGVLPAGGTIEAPIGRHPHDRIKMAVVDDGRPAVTHYRVIERFTHHTLLSVRLETGRTHQIRVHLAHMKHPIVGDAVYSDRNVRGQFPEPLRQKLKTFPRQALHARELELAHPATGKTVHASAPMPADMRELVVELRQHAAQGGARR
ncbi:MAG: 23S rRNA pseudouridine(1911/1915/1917) synthase RluD [Gammaproteobacteria bacterium]|nr:23S rRNA pseudouridine(1911/1915/1917) synthase RluD [Gammaproteobacteria bacterium]